MDFRFFTVEAHEYPPGLRQGRHSHDYSNITIVTAGQIEEAAENGEVRGRPGSVVLKAAGCEHEDRISGTGASTLTIRFDSESTFGRRVPDRAWLWQEDAAIVRHALTVCGAFRRDDATAAERNAMVLVESVLAGGAPEGPAPPWIERLREIIDARFDEPLRFDSLARDFGLHPVYASRAFRRHVGVSMTEYVRGLRLRRARHELSLSGRSIASIAQHSGFADSSHLCRSFRSLLGTTPAAYRRATARRG